MKTAQQYTMWCRLMSHDDRVDNEVDIPDIATNQSPVLTRRNLSLSVTHGHLDTCPPPLSHDTHVIPEYLQIPPPAINHVLAKIKLCTDALGDKREFS